MKIVHCRQCDREVATEARFCSHCGALQAEDAAPTARASDGADTLSGNLTGHAFGAATPAATPPAVSAAEASYANSLRVAFQDGRVSAEEQQLLDQLQQALGLSNAQVERIKDEVTGQSTDERRRAVDVSKLPIGMPIGDSLVLGPMLGGGGMGAVYRVTHRITQKDRAIKILAPHLAGKPEAMNALQHEVGLAQELRHDNLCAVYSLESVQGLQFILMEYLDGKDLAVLLRERGPLPPAEIVELSQGILAGLDYLHGKGYVHKDVKPRNVMLTRGGEVKLIDYGIATSIREQMAVAGYSDTSGTPFYMAPEQIRGEVVDRTADIYSLGMLFYELLTGRLPFTGTKEAALAWHQAAELRLPGVEDWHWQEFLARCLARRPRDRFPTCNALGEALRALVPATARPAAGAPTTASGIFAAATASRPPLPSPEIDRRHVEYVNKPGTVFDADPQRVRAPLPQHPDNLVSECRRLLANQLFDTRGPRKIYVLQARGVHSRFIADLDALEKWAYFYPEYRGDYLTLWNRAATMLEWEPLDPSCFAHPALVAKYATGAPATAAAAAAQRMPLAPVAPPPAAAAAAPSSSWWANTMGGGAPRTPNPFGQLDPPPGAGKVVSKVLTWSVQGCIGCSIVGFLMMVGLGIFLQMIE